MGTSQDWRDREQRAGSSGAGLPIPLQRIIQSRKLNANGYDYVGEPINVLDPTIDNIWAQGRNTSVAPHNYFDYYFTGQDIAVWIDGSNHNELDIIQFAFNVQQQKTPLYGFASYTYDAMMRGNRIVSGVMRIATKDIHRMTQVLQDAAIQRANQNASYVLRGLTDDEELIETYWTRNIDPEISNNGNKHIWSSHPPFNLVINYGIQSTSVKANPNKRVEEVQQRYKLIEPDNAYFTDMNERLVESDPIGYSQRRVIENVELTGLQVEYGPEGQVCSEVYSFLARDIKLVDLTVR